MSKESKEKQLDIRRHNSYFGFARCMQAQCRMMRHSWTTTPETRRICDEIDKQAELLYKSLKTKRGL